MVLLDQSPALTISIIVTPDQAADEQAAPLTECALKVSVSTPASWRHVHNHLAICFPIHERKRVDLDSPVLKECNFHTPVRLLLDTAIHLEFRMERKIY